MSRLIYNTKNYDKFTFLPGNRPVEHWKEIADSMKELKTFSPPIVVKKNGDGKLVILEGQNRFIALKHLGRSIDYIFPNIEMGLPEVRAMNKVQKKWNLSQYLHSFRETENNPRGPYHTFDWFQKKYSLPFQVCIDLLAKSPMQLKSVNVFKDGKLVIKNLTQAIREADFLTSMKDYTRLHKRYRFVRALYMGMRDSRFNTEQFTDQLKNPRCRSLLYERDTTAQYMDCINDVYNYRVRDEDKVFFSARKKGNGAYVKPAYPRAVNG